MNYLQKKHANIRKPLNINNLQIIDTKNKKKLKKVKKTLEKLINALY